MVQIKNIKTETGFEVVDYIGITIIKYNECIKLKFAISSEINVLKIEERKNMSLYRKIGMCLKGLANFRIKYQLNKIKMLFLNHVLRGEYHFKYLAVNRKLQ